MRTCLYLLVVLFSVTNIYALPSQLSIPQVDKLFADTPATKNYFGSSVAVSGDVLVVGAYGYDYNKGKVYVYKLNPDTNTFIQKAKLQPWRLIVNDNFGISVAISGDTIIVGADGYLDDTGGVFIFEKPEGGWVDVIDEATRLTPDASIAGKVFGDSIAISGDTIVVGAYKDDDDSNTSSGAVYVFNKPESGWQQPFDYDHIPVATLKASDAASFDYFGKSVAINEETIVVGAYKDDDGDLNTNNYSHYNSGSVYVFKKPSAGWANVTEDAKLNASDADQEDYFGYSVAISGDSIVVGAYQSNNGAAYSGSVYVFEKPSGGWVNMTETAELSAFDASYKDYFGRRVAISGDRIVVAADGNDDAGESSGSAYLFKKPPGGWVSMTENAKLTAADASEGDYFARSVAINADFIVAGTHKDDEQYIDSGAAYIFQEKGLKAVFALPAIISLMLN